MNLDGKRVRLRGSGKVGTVFCVHGGVGTVGVIWDSAPHWVVTVPVSRLIVVTSEPVGVPPEARPHSVGGLASPERRHK